jgi:hypothetical protein
LSISCSSEYRGPFASAVTHPALINCPSNAS